MPRKRPGRLSWFPWYVDDFGGGVCTFDGAQTGHYVLLLNAQWNSKHDRSIPSDPAILRRICHGEAPSAQVLAKFLRITVGSEQRLRNKRLSDEWEKAWREYSGKARPRKGADSGSQSAPHSDPESGADSGSHVGPHSGTQPQPHSLTERERPPRVEEEGDGMEPGAVENSTTDNGHGAPQRVWSRILDRLKRNGLDPTRVRNFLEACDPLSFDGKLLLVRVGVQSQLDWIRGQFGAQANEAAREGGAEVEVRFVGAKPRRGDP